MLACLPSKNESIDRWWETLIRDNSANAGHERQRSGAEAKPEDRTHKQAEWWYANIAPLG